jgi:hypothetical protein
MNSSKPRRGIAPFAAACSTAALLVTGAAHADNSARSRPHQPAPKLQHLSRSEPGHSAALETATSTSCTLTRIPFTVLSNCFPKVQVAVDWVAHRNESELDTGAVAGNFSWAFTTQLFPEKLWAEMGKASGLGDNVTVTSNVEPFGTNPCDIDADFTGSTIGTIDQEVLTGGVLAGAWIDGPQEDTYYNLGVTGTGTMDCGSGSPGPFPWAAGSPDAGAICSNDPAGQPLAGWWYGHLTETGSLATGRVDTWDFTCHYDAPQPEIGFAADLNGQMRMQEDPCPRVRTGKGYAQLKDATRNRLRDFYDALDAAGGCYQFVVGYRSQAEQDHLRLQWHAIADKDGPGDHRTPEQINQQLRAAGFAQPFQGRAANGIAIGGPAKKSRHTSMEAADVRIGFRPIGVDTVRRTPGLAKLLNPHVRYFAGQAGLCGPPVADLVHVEMPYKKGNETVARCHFG